MDVEYTRMIKQEKNCRQLRLQFPVAFIGRAVGGERMGYGEDRYFSPLQSLLYHRT